MADESQEIELPEDAPYWIRLRYLRQRRKLSQPALFKLVDAVSLDTIRALEADPSNGTTKGRPRYPSAITLERLSEALDVSPNEFPEYRLAKAREMLDERASGLLPALKCLDAFQAGLVRNANESAARALERPAHSHPRRRATDHEGPNGRANGAPGS